MLFTYRGATILKKTQSRARKDHRVLAELTWPAPLMETYRQAHDTSPRHRYLQQRTPFGAVESRISRKRKYYASRNREVVQRPEGLWFHPAGQRGVGRVRPHQRRRAR